MRIPCGTILAVAVVFSIPDVRLLLPDFAKDAAPVATTVGGDGAVRLEFKGGRLARGVVSATPHRRGFVVKGEFVPDGDVTMNRLDILPSGTRTLFYEINNYRNMHATDQVFERVVLGAREFAANT